MAVPFVLSLGGMGLGDVKLSGFIGLMVSFLGVFVKLFLGIVGGGLVAASLLLLRVRGRNDLVPFGPFPTAAILVTLVSGRQLLDWYPVSLET